jgi:penicillin-binding protein 2
VICVCLFGTLFARLAYLQVAEAPSFKKEATRNLSQRVNVAAPRGRIFGRDGRVFVDNRIVLTVSIVKAELPRRAAAKMALFTRLASVLGIAGGGTEVKRRFEAIDNLQGVEVARPITESAQVYLAEHQEEFPGVKVKRDSQRIYPRGTLAAHVLGYVSDIGDDLKNPICNARYQTGDRVGKAGIERRYECILRGMPGVNELVVDRKNKVISTNVISPPIPGTDVWLTVDPEIQAFTEKALDSGLRSAKFQSGYVYLGNSKKEEKAGKKPFKANAGVAVVFDSTDGSVLSMVSRPVYDPSELARGITAKNFAAKYGDETAGAPLLNRAVSGRYAPGSTFKIFTAISALNNGLITAKSTYEDTGKFSLDNCTFKCVFYNAGKTPHGRVDLRQSLVVSSDVFYYWLGYRFWNDGIADRDAIQQTARQFGFGGDTGIALPNEKSYDVPDAATKKARHDSDPDIWPDGSWRTGDNLNLAIGQGEMSATPLQEAVAYATFANGGSLLVPRIAFDVPPPLIPTEILVGGSTTTTTTSSSVPLTSAPSTTTFATTVPTATRTSADTTSAATTSADTTSADTTAVIGSAGLGPQGRFGPLLIAPKAQASPSSSPSPSRPGPSDPSASSTLPGADPSGPPAASTIPTQRPALTKVQVRSVDLSSDVRDPILSGLRGVVADKSGTAAKAFIGFPLDSFPIAGKTGTAQVLGKQDFSLFVAFGGPNNRYVVVVIMEQAGFGGQAAAPVARQIFNGLAGLTVTSADFIPDATKDN